MGGLSPGDFCLGGHWGGVGLEVFTLFSRERAQALPVGRGVEFFRDWNLIEHIKFKGVPHIILLRRRVRVGAGE